MCFLHGLMAELSVKTYIDKVLLCDLVNNSLTPPGGKNNTYCYNNSYSKALVTSVYKSKSLAENFKTKTFFYHCVQKVCSERKSTSLTAVFEVCSLPNPGLNN